MKKDSELRQAGLKATLPRLKILEILEHSEPHHMSAEDVYRKLVEADEEIGIATVYRVLTQFEAAGLVNRLNFDGGHAVFEVRREGHHDHMVVLNTNKVVEFYSSELEDLQRRIVSEHGYDLVDHSLILFVRPKK